MPQVQQEVRLEAAKETILHLNHKEGRIDYTN